MNCVRIFYLKLSIFDKHFEISLVDPIVIEENLLKPKMFSAAAAALAFNTTSEKALQSLLEIFLIRLSQKNRLLFDAYITRSDSHGQTHTYSIR